jgi:hypothetical protein
MREAMRSHSERMLRTLRHHIHHIASSLMRLSKILWWSQIKQLRDAIRTCHRKESLPSWHSAWADQRHQPWKCQHRPEQVSILFSGSGTHTLYRLLSFPNLIRQIISGSTTSKPKFFCCWCTSSISLKWHVLLEPPNDEAVHTHTGQARSR